MNQEPETQTIEQDVEYPNLGLQATYSPDDNKLRLYAMQRLPKELYLRVKAAGFKWAPKQDLFVAPMWTPSREDLLIELCGEVGDEDKSLVERQEERSERFEEYSEKRAADAHSAKASVDAIADGIPLGQPILVGHHSERHARKHAERIENGMRRAVKMWETSKYWTDRAAGALRHAKYKELPGVRFRRIKGLESDLRRQEKRINDCVGLIDAWESPTLNHDRALYLSEVNHAWSEFTIGDKTDSAYGFLKKGTATFEEVRARMIVRLNGSIEDSKRWRDHYLHRLEYERAMLNEQGGIKADKFNFEIGGRVCRRGTWMVIVKINRRQGEMISLTVTNHWKTTISMEEVQDYRPPEPGDTEKAKKIMKLPPLCNYNGKGFKEMTFAEWSKNHWSDFSYTRTIKDSTEYEPHRVRCWPAPKWSYQFVFITDKPVVKAPPKQLIKEVVEPIKVRPDDAPLPIPRVYTPPAQTDFDLMKDSLKAGVKTVVANQLFPTPSDLADKMVELAFGGGPIDPDLHILEPSAGTGAILDAIRRLGHPGAITAVEINRSLADRLEQRFPGTVICADFLSWDPGRKFDRIIMNPPFENGVDIKHVEHALTLLERGGTLVAIVADGPRQKTKLEPLSALWEPLPPDTFKTQGTSVNTVLMTIEKVV